MSSQINFYMMPDDVAELDEYLKKNGWVIVAKKSPTKELVVLPNLISLNDSVTIDTLSAYLTLPHLLQTIQTTFIEQQKSWFISEMDSEVMQYRKTVNIPDENIFNPGRLYYQKEKLLPVSGMEKVSPEFLDAANKLFSWYKRHFRNTKINSYHTTPRAKEFIESKTMVPV